MYERPDYTTAREQAGFGWSVSGSQGALRALTGVPIRDFNLDPAACIETYRRGRPRLREMFGEEVGLPGVCTPAVSYGHVNGLGSELLFPEGGEVAHTHIYSSVGEGLAALQKPVDFAHAGMAPFYLEFRERLREAFPGEKVGFGYGAEGPFTTAYELRGDGFFTDIFDDPAGARRFMEAVTDSIIEFDRWYAAVNGNPFPNPTGGGMGDDIASFIPERLYPELVVPIWERLYSASTTGRRSAHVEDLRVQQLPYLETIGLSRFDPSISPRLNPRLFATHCRVPFSWRLGCFHYRDMSHQEIRDFVFQSAADDASGVFSTVAEAICNEEGAAKVRTFIAAAKEVKQLFEAGASREALGQMVSPEGKAKLWEGWCGYNSPQSTRGGAKVPARE